jgi:dTDP-glucose 4,6-dehydratase
MRLYDGRAVPTLLRQAILSENLTVFGDGSQTRSFCYVSDLIEGIYKLMLSDIVEPVNLGNPNEMSILEFARLVKKITETQSGIEFKELPVDDPKVRQPDINRAKELLGWEPTVPVEDGLKWTFAWLQERMQRIEKSQEQHMRGENERSKVRGQRSKVKGEGSKAKGEG